MDLWLEKKIRADLGIPDGKEPGYTAHQLLWVNQNREMVIVELTAKFNEIFGTDYKASRLNSLRKRHGWSTGRTGCFSKGHKPWNAGKKGIQTGGKETRFKKGHHPKNHLPVGTTVITSDGYKRTKIAEPNQWRFTHVMEWEKHHGPVTTGHAVKFRDGDPINTDINNLVLISRAELLRLNKHGYDKMPTALKPTVMAIAKLEVATFAKQKEGCKVAPC